MKMGILGESSPISSSGRKIRPKNWANPKQNEIILKIPVQKYKIAAKGHQEGAKSIFQN